jgi:uncharacterized repeat protein (TIGR03987 family)
MLGSAIVFITLALIFYTIGVWAEKLKGILKMWHVIIFWFGFICDTVGTSIMGSIARASADVEKVVQSGMNFHAITGVLAIVLMLFHATWASVVIVKKNEKMKKTFHKFSLLVWVIWLVPYISGMVMGMRH